MSDPTLTVEAVQPLPGGDTPTLNEQPTPAGIAGALEQHKGVNVATEGDTGIPSAAARKETPLTRFPQQELAAIHNAELQLEPWETDALALVRQFRDGLIIGGTGEDDRKNAMSAAGLGFDLTRLAFASRAENSKLVPSEALSEGAQAGPAGISSETMAPVLPSLPTSEAAPVLAAVGAGATGGPTS